MISFNLSCEACEDDNKDEETVAQLISKSFHTNKYGTRSKFWSSSQRSPSIRPQRMCQVRNDQEKTSPVTERTSGLKAEGRETQENRGQLLILPLTVPQRQPPGLYLLRVLISLLPTAEPCREAGDQPP
jgi:hypothetical protein